MSKRITIDLEGDYYNMLSITAVGSRHFGEIHASTWAFDVAKTTWITVEECGKVREHGTDKPEEAV